MSIRIATANVRGTAGFSGAGLEELRELCRETDVLALLELLECQPVEPSAIKMRYANPLKAVTSPLSSPKAAYFHPVYDSDASPAAPKWKRLPDRVRVGPNQIRRISSGIGLIYGGTILPVHPEMAPYAAAAPVVGRLGMGSPDYSPLLYKGTRDTEHRAAIFLHLSLGSSSYMICIAHFTTLEGEIGDKTIAREAGKIRSWQAREISGALDYLAQQYSERNNHPRLMVMGDFNAHPEDVSLAPFRDLGLRPVFEDLPGPYPATRTDLNRCIDHIWIEKALRVKSVDVAPVGRSDHLAVCASLE